MSAPWQGALTEKKFAPARTDQNIPHFPHNPRGGHPNLEGLGNVGKEGKRSTANDGGDSVFTARYEPRTAAMERSAVSTSPAVRANRACRGDGSASGRGAVAEKTFAPAATGPNIPRIPHFPRNRHPDPAEAGNVGKKGKPPAASRPNHSVFGQGLIDPG